MLYAQWIPQVNVDVCQESFTICKYSQNVSHCNNNIISMLINNSFYGVLNTALEIWIQIMYSF